MGGLLAGLIGVSSGHVEEAVVDFRKIHRLFHFSFSVLQLLPIVLLVHALPFGQLRRLERLLVDSGQGAREGFVEGDLFLAQTHLEKDLM